MRHPLPVTVGPTTVFTSMVIILVCVALAAAPVAAQTPLRLTDADLPLLREYLAIDAAAMERASRRSNDGVAAFDQEMASYEADRETMRRKIRAGEIDQLTLLREGGSTGFLVPDGTTYDVACSRRHDVDPGYVVYRGAPTGGGAAASAQVRAWIRWYASKGYSSADAYTPGTTLLGPADREKGPREVNISIQLVDELCGDAEPRVHVNGWHGESDRQAERQLRFDRVLRTADTLEALPSAEEALSARGRDPAAYLARREALTAAYLSRNLSDLEWRISAEGESAAVQAEIAARRANVAWLMASGKELLPVLRRYLGS